MHVAEGPQPVPPSAPGILRDRQAAATDEVRGATIWLAGCILLAIALRFLRLGTWGFDSDEVFMLRDSLHLQPRNPRPLMYLLNHYVILPFIPLDEFGLRLLPAIFGVLSVPVFYFLARRLVGTRAALFGTFLVASSGLLVYYSQFARYWTLVFMLSATYPYAIYLGIRHRNGRAIALGLALAALAALAHPVSVLLLVALGVWCITEYVRRDRLAHLWSQKRVRWGTVAALVLAAVLAARFIPVLQSWIRLHDVQSQAGGGSEFLFRVPGGRALGRVALLMGFVESLTLPLVLAGVLGISMLWRRRSRSIASLLTCLFVIPIVLIMLISLRTAISTFYMLPAVPPLFMGAGVFLEGLRSTDTELRPRWLLSAAVTVMILATGAPTLVSQYRDGRRYDFRGVARWLDHRLTPADVVISDQSWVMTHYLPEVEVERLVPDSVRLSSALAALRKPGAEGVLWVVVPSPSHAFRTNPGLSQLNGWMYEHCQLRNTIGVGRMDFRQNFLQVFRCLPATPEAAVERDNG
jgi:mannosyltransferase